MTHPQGTITAEHGGTSYRLEMNFGVLADLEDRYGDDFQSIMNGEVAPKIKMMIDAVLLSLIEGTPDLEEEEARKVARKITSPSIFADLLTSAFPDAEVQMGKTAPGNPKRPKRAA